MSEQTVALLEMFQASTIIICKNVKACHYCLYPRQRSEPGQKSSHRRSGIDKINELKDDLPADELKRYESKIQELTDKFVSKIDELYKIKENELLEV